MRVLVCVRQGLDGELGPFDAAAYECALQLPESEVILLSMGVPKTAEYLRSLTRLGAKEAILLTDPAFAGADTLATAYTLAAAVKRLSPDLVLCGRQTLIGDTAQTGPMLATLLGWAMATNMTAVKSLDPLTVKTRDGAEKTLPVPALLTVERSYTLRFPSLFSRPGEVQTLTAADLSLDPARCGLSGSPTRVLETFQNEGGKRKCRFIKREELEPLIAAVLCREPTASPKRADGERLSHVLIVGEAPRPFAEGIADKITCLSANTPLDVVRFIENDHPAAVLFGSDDVAKKMAAEVAATLGLGLCADCTELETEGDEMIMYRPALSGSLIAKIRSLTRPALATVRTQEVGSGLIVGAGYGVKDCLEAVKAFAAAHKAELVASRRLVDNGYMPYSTQVGLTGRTVSPPVYLAIGISGAGHHIAGVSRAGTLIAINNDPDAPIFDYADYGIVGTF